MSYKRSYDDTRYNARYNSDKKKYSSLKEELSLGVQSKKGRTAVFAGHARSVNYTHVHTLEDLCLRVLMDHIDKITYVGDASYNILKPVLKKCNPTQLAKIERLNPHLLEDTDELWMEISKKEFKNKQPDSDDDETWRELYFRLLDERDEKLKKISKNISAKIAKSLPVRQTQRAFVEVNEKPKPPKEVKRKQEKVATSSSNKVEKPKTAPLMKKTLLMYKKTCRR